MICKEGEGGGFFVFFEGNKINILVGVNILPLKKQILFSQQKAHLNRFFNFQNMFIKKTLLGFSIVNRV